MDIPRAMIKAEESRHAEIFTTTMGGWPSQHDKQLAYSLASMTLDLGLVSPSKNRMWKELEYLGISCWKSDIALLEAQQRNKEVKASLEQATQLRLNTSRMAQHVPSETSQAEAWKACAETTEFHQASLQSTLERASLLEESLIQSGFREDLSHEAILAEVEELSAIEKEIAAVDAKLAVYQDIPDDLVLAQTLLEGVQREVERLEKERGSLSSPQTAEKQRWFGM